MTLTFTTQSIITAGAVVAAIIALVGYLRKAFGWFDMQKKQDTDIREIKEEQAVICFALSACLDGLMQLGANHSVPIAKEKLDKHLNKEAHKV